ncbi:hypothetical protein B4099_0711 [Heyndrickxia coagulans]|uniref:Uncharacterized protein n=1 Tax=Heyndrickxia coagulans TaxID=1398 RepID=A0A150K7Z0_HEYCO|nr:hypothetical protein B4099_0711 [Heyndrickxia coagulans]
MERKQARLKTFPKNLDQKIHYAIIKNRNILLVFGVAVPEQIEKMVYRAGFLLE